MAKLGVGAVASAVKGIGFSKGTFKALRVQLRQDIMSSTESSAIMRAEISRVFQMANRRIQNIERTGLYSPALEALGKGDIERYTKFSMVADSWTDLKREYAKAVGFLRQPTSTATGTREYCNYLKRTYDLSDEDFQRMVDYLKGKSKSIEDEDYVERYLMQYKDFTGEAEQEAQDVSSMIENEAVSVMNALQANLDTSVNKMVNKVDWGKAFSLESELENLLS